MALIEAMGRKEQPYIFLITHVAQPSRLVYKTRTIDTGQGDGRWRNKVQYQKGLSEAEFERRYGSEEQCRAAVAGAIAWSRPALYQCTACRRQTSLTAGTIFAATKLALRSWFRALYHLTQSKQGISSLELGRRLGVTQTTAWTVKHKLKQVMMERDAKKRLIGRVEMDDAYLGGQRSGGKRGRGAAGKTPIVATVETTAEGRPVRLKLRRVRGFRRSEIEAFAKRSLDPGCSVVSDGLSCFRGVTAAWLHPPADPHRLGPQGGPRACLQVGQHRATSRRRSSAPIGRNWLRLMRNQVHFCTVAYFPGGLVVEHFGVYARIGATTDVRLRANGNSCRSGETLSQVVVGNNVFGGTEVGGR